MLNKKTVTDMQVSGKRVLVRCDFNVPLDRDQITDENRIIGALPTIQYLVEHKARVILCSHLGRPKGEFNMKYSLAPVAKRLSEKLGQEVKLAKDVIGSDAQALAAALGDGEVMLLENVRFHNEEEKNDADFSKALASLADIYINDAFGTAHRAHASTAGVADYLPSAAGFLIGKELDIMGKALDDPDRPFVAILGGAKVSDKIKVIENLLNKVDALIIGGGMAFTFFKAMGYDIGKSLLEADKVDYAKEMIEQAKAKGVQLLFPVDTVAASAFAADAEHKVVDSKVIPEGWMGLDIGPKAQKEFSDCIKNAKTVIWNGPMGVFEMAPFATGTKAIAQALADCNGTTIVGGGDSAAAIEQMGFAKKVTHVSTGGGASLEFLEGLVLPGVACLNDK